MELKQGDFVIVWDIGVEMFLRGIVLFDENVEGSDIYVAVLRYGVMENRYYAKKFIMKVI